MTPTSIPTRWRTTFEEQLDDAARRIESAEGQLQKGEGRRALQDVYPAVVAAATVRVWLDHPPWVKPLPGPELQRRTRQAFPSRFSAMASLDPRDVLNSPWPVDAVRPYLDEARSFLKTTREQLDACLARN